MPALKLPASILHGDHFVAFKTSLSNILLTNRAEDTYAQIIDGMPTADVWDEYANRRHEWIENHKQLCPTTREKTKAFQANFSPDELHLDTSARDIFIHPYEPHRLIFQLSEAQIQQFADFVIPLSLSLSQRPVPPFPFKAERQTRRVDPWDAMATLHIFRNRYERKLPARRVYNCVLTPEDYPEIEDQTKTIRERFI
ncbi:hypothetical protein FQN51_001652 [Onygenales sp. PD_10]|nr:hypothetical protein FQN51_001652 [Onygenales sp. PD_10]